MVSTKSRRVQNVRKKFETSDKDNLLLLSLVFFGSFGIVIVCTVLRFEYLSLPIITELPNVKRVNSCE